MKLVRVIGLSGKDLYNIGTCSVRIMENFVELKRVNFDGSHSDYLNLEVYEVERLTWAELKLGMGKMYLNEKDYDVIINKGTLT